MWAAVSHPACQTKPRQLGLCWVHSTSRSRQRDPPTIETTSSHRQLAPPDPTPAAVSHPPAKLSRRGLVCAGVHNTTTPSRSRQRDPPTIETTSSNRQLAPPEPSPATISYPTCQTKPRRLGLCWVHSTLRLCQRNPPTIETTSSNCQLGPPEPTPAAVSHPFAKLGRRGSVCARVHTTTTPSRSCQCDPRTISTKAPSIPSYYHSVIFMLVLYLLLICSFCLCTVLRIKITIYST
jgi:hypothetical protein